MNTKIYDLPCYDNRDSFYGKTKVIEEDKRILLQSYSTIVGYIENGIFHKTYSGYSATTMRHVNSFLDHFNLSGGGKKWWDSLTTESIEE